LEEGIGTMETGVLSGDGIAKEERGRRNVRERRGNIRHPTV